MLWEERKQARLAPAGPVPMIRAGYSRMEEVWSGEVEVPLTPFGVVAMF